MQTNTLLTFEFSEIGFFFFFDNAKLAPVVDMEHTAVLFYMKQSNVSNWWKFE